MWVVPIVGAAVLVAGCAGDDDEPQAAPRAPTTTADRGTVPTARTQREWTNRLRPFLRAMNRDFQILNNIRNPQIRAYLYGGNPDTLNVLNKTLRRLRACSRRLEAIGRPPAGRPALASVYRDFSRACRSYDRLGTLLLEAVPLLSSQKQEEQREASALFQQAAEPSRTAALYFGRGLQTIAANRLMPDVVPAEPIG